MKSLIYLLSFINIVNGNIWKCENQLDIKDCTSLSYCTWCLENTTNTTFKCFEFNSCNNSYPGKNCTKNDSIYNNYITCKIVTLIYILTIISLQFLVSGIIISLFLNITSPNNTIIYKEQYLIFGFGGFLTVTGLLVFFLYPLYLLTYVLIIFSILVTLGIISISINYKRNGNILPPRYHALEE